MIETGTQADHEQVAYYIDQLYRATAFDLNRQQILGRADDMLAAGPVFFIRDCTGRIGYAALKEMGDHVFLRHFVIEAGRRGGGTGARAFTALQEACFPGREIRLDASHTVDAPRAFWESQGFEIMGYTMRRAAPEEAT